MLFYCVAFIAQIDKDDPDVNKPHSSSRQSQEAPPTYYKDKYRHLLGIDSGKDAAKATKSNSAYGYGKCTVNQLMLWSPSCTPVGLIKKPEEELVSNYLLPMSARFDSGRLSCCWLNNLLVFSPC